MKHVLTTPALKKAAALAVRFGTGYLVARGVTFGEYAPFGLGYVAAVSSSGGALYGIAGTLGVLLGYLRLWALADSIKYVACAVLIYTIAAAFHGTKISTRRLFAPLSALISAAATGFVFVIGRGITGAGIALYISELILVFGFAYFACEVFTPRKTPRTDNVRSFALLVVVAAAALGASGSSLLLGMSPGRVAAVLVILLAAHAGGLPAGAAAGVTLGVVFDIGGGGGFFSMSYGLCGLLAGVVARGGKFAAAAVYVLAGGLLVLAEGADAPRFAALYETFLASIIFMFIPEKFHLPAGFELFTRTPDAHASDRRASAALKRIAGAYAVLGGAVASDTPVERREVDADATFTRAARRACDGCSRTGVCWSAGAPALSELRAAARTLRERAVMEAADLPPAFASRCLKPAEFAAAVSDEYRAGQLDLRRRVRAERETQRVREQYAGVAAVLTGVAEHIEVDEVPSGGGSSVKISAACRRRSGSAESGDRGTWFRAPDGSVVVLLSDGMGSGAEAARASEEVLRLTESFMTAGAAAADSVEAVSCALAARGTQVFATLDLLRLDTTRRSGELVKCGAAQSYIRGGGVVCRVGGTGLPPGVEGAEPVSRRFNLAACDMIVMLTDGAVDTSEGDAWLCSLIEAFEGDSKALALAVVEAASERTGCSDDISVIAVALN